LNVDLYRRHAGLVARVEALAVGSGSRYWWAHYRRLVNLLWPYPA
jgi:hypothetical protein